VMFITPNELTVMYQLWSHLSGKGRLKSCAVVKNGLPNTNFSGTCSFMKMGSCGLTNSLSSLYTSPSSLYDTISHALIYVSTCCAGADIAELVPIGLFRFLIAAKNWSLDLNKALFCTGLGPCGLFHKEMMRVGAYPVQVKLPCPLELLSQWEEMVVAKLPCPLQATKVVVAELLVDQEEWQVHGPQVTTSVFDLTLYAASVGISTHLRKFRAGSTI
jgi:hypothetical protein